MTFRASVLSRVAVVILCSSFVAPTAAPAAEVETDVGLTEHKRNVVVDVNRSEARLIQIRNRVIRTSVSDPRIFEPVVVAENQFYIVGKNPGRATLGIWDDAGCVESIEIRVTKTGSKTPFMSGLSFFKKLVSHGEKQGLAASPMSKLDFTESARKIDKSMFIEEQGWATSFPEWENKKGRRNKIEPRTDTICVPPDGKEIIIRIGTEACQRHRPVDLQASQSRLLKINGRIVETVIKDPDVSEGVVVSENEIVLLGKHPGHTVLAICDEFGNKEALDITVKKPFRSPLGFRFTELTTGLIDTIFGAKKRSALRRSSEMPLDKLEQKVETTIELRESEPKVFRVKNSIVRTVVSDPKVASLSMVSPNEFGLLGRATGNATIFVWDDFGNREAIRVRVTKSSNKASLTAKGKVLSSPNDRAVVGKQEPDKDSLPEADSDLSNGVHLTECWVGNQKDIVQTRYSDPE
jgi:hypothetical protein